MFNIEVNENIERIIHNIDANKAKIELAAVRVLNKTALWLKSQAVREISEEKQIRLKVIRKRLRIIKARKSTLKVLIRAYLYDMRMRNIKQAKIRTAFNDAFMATMPRGYRGIFKRVGRTALPIQEVKLPLEPEASRIIENLVNYEVERIFEKYFTHELFYDGILD
ncbi:MAG: phage tail protein [Wolbachia endosymbiont of Nomada fabriciana]|uniref:phage tail protein n=1 Tax=unclassified Wolbachia TaxID=2640676 RepID=UPI002231B1CB|nr:phage tail protein [Wolbachia endosymbiont (group A) of Nomada fabriciana]MDX5496448.1 phage tail protein [Wolbachia endosymbiont of Nomada fabriciana]